MKKYFVAILSLLFYAVFAQTLPTKIAIDFQQKGATVQPSMYGIKKNSI